MALVLPSTVEDINLQQSLAFAASQDNLGKPINKDFVNMSDGNALYKGMFNLPKVNIKSANDLSPLASLDTYFVSPIDSNEDFKDIFFKVDDFKEDRLVPEDSLSRQRCDSLSSIASSFDDKLYQPRFTGAIKTFNTIRMDSGSTCIDQTYVDSPASAFTEQPMDESYHDLTSFLQQVPEMTISENLPSPLSVSGSDSNFDFTLLQGSYSMCSASSSQDVVLGRGVKRPASTSSTDDLFSPKQLCPSPSPVQYEVRRKNNISSKNCRKTRKEKQKEMETQLTDLQAENGELQMQIKVLQEMITASKMQLYAILNKR